MEVEVGGDVVLVVIVECDGDAVGFGVFGVFGGSSPLRCHLDWWSASRPSSPT